MTTRTLSTRAALLASAALCATVLAAAPASAQVQQDDSLTGSLVNMTGKALSAIGVIAPEAPPIDYRERAPLVVPPTGDVLPPPRDGAAMSQNPAWPKDHDEVVRQAAATPGSMFDDTFTAHKKLTASQMKNGVKDGNRPAYGSGFNDARSNQANKLAPKQLEFFGWNNKKEEKLEFEGEPDRDSLTQPPTGYQTPAPNAKYGVVADRPEDKEWSMPSWFDRTQANK